MTGRVGSALIPGLVAALLAGLIVIWVVGTTASNQQRGEHHGLDHKQKSISKHHFLDFQFKTGCSFITIPMVPKPKTNDKMRKG